MSTNDDRPIFLPLLGIYFDAFERGEKTLEWRRFNNRWNFKSCRVGRRVTLSRGYSGRRLSARIRSVALASVCDHALVELFGARAVCIVIELHEIVPFAAI